MKHRVRMLLLAALVVAVGSIAIQAPGTAATKKKAAAPSCGAKVLKSSGKAWTCRFADEFSGTKLDGTKWSVQQTAVSGHSGAEADCWVNSPNNISVANGTLRLTSREEPKPIVCKAPRGHYTTKYTSGSVTTWGHFAQTYGRWQIRAKFPDANVTGSHSALWLFPRDQAYGEWPSSGEIDIAEYYTRAPDRVIPVIHYNAVGRANRTRTNKKCMVADPWNFHVYTAEWTPGRIQIWIDKTLCVDHTVRSRRPHSSTAPFDQPFATYLTQSLGVGRNRFRDVGRNATPLPVRTEVDWVHVWS
jgi:beta-glucanase (GH16 family)